MKAYTFKIDTKEYVGEEVEVQENPMWNDSRPESDRWIYPGYSLLKDIPSPAPEKKVWVADLTQKDWVLKDDYRGTKYWEQDGTEKEITEIGEEVPEGCLTDPPKNRWYKTHDGVSWLIDPSDINEIKEEKLNTLASNTQFFINKTVYQYCQAEQMTWENKLVPQATAYLANSSAVTPFLDNWVNGMLLENPSLDFATAKQELAVAIDQNNKDYEILVPRVMGVSTAKRDKIKEIAGNNLLSSAEKEQQLNTLDLNIQL